MNKFILTVILTSFFTIAFLPATELEEANRIYSEELTRDFKIMQKGRMSAVAMMTILTISHDYIGYFNEDGMRGFVFVHYGKETGNTIVMYFRGWKFIRAEYTGRFATAANNHH